MGERRRSSPTDVDRQTVLADVLRTFRRELAETVRPEVSAAYPAYVVDLMGAVMEYMEDWLLGAGYPEVEAGRAALLADQAGESPRVLLPAFEEVVPREEALAARIDAVARAGDDAALARIGTAVAALDDTLHAAQGARLAAARGSERAILDAIYPSVTAERVERYVQGKLGMGDERVVRVTEIPGGHSKDTYIVQLRSGRELVIRRDFPFGPVETSAPDEFELLRRLADAGMPVARPLAAEYDRAHLGLPFLVVEKVAGGDPVLQFAARPELARAVGLELARILARLHRFEPQALGFRASTDSPRRQVLDYLLQWRAWWEANRVHLSSLLEAGFVWLERNVPEDIERIVVVHGDARPGNMLAQDGQVTALLDWEFAHPGDPAEDLLYALGFVQGALTSEEFLAEYRAAGGAPISDSGARYYDIFRTLRNVVCCEVAWGGFVLGKYPAFKLVSQGIVYKRMLAQELAKSMRQLSW